VIILPDLDLQSIIFWFSEDDALPLNDTRKTVSQVTAKKLGHQEPKGIVQLERKRSRRRIYAQQTLKNITLSSE